MIPSDFAWGLIFAAHTGTRGFDYVNVKADAIHAWEWHKLSFRLRTNTGVIQTIKIKILTATMGFRENLKTEQNS